MYYWKTESMHMELVVRREIDHPYPDLQVFSPLRPEFEIVGAFGADPITIDTIISGDGATPGNVITVLTSNTSWTECWHTNSYSVELVVVLIIISLP